jgi:hypothetical protein
MPPFSIDSDSTARKSCKLCTVTVNGAASQDMLPHTLACMKGCRQPGQQKALLSPLATSPPPPLLPLQEASAERVMAWWRRSGDLHAGAARQPSGADHHSSPPAVRTVDPPLASCIPCLAQVRLAHFGTALPARACALEAAPAGGAPALACSL